MRGAFSEIDITPALPAEKPGWIVKIMATAVDDPLLAHVLVLEDDSKTRVAFVSLDVLSVRWPLAEAIRDRAGQAGIPRDNVMVAATHNHTGGPVSSVGLCTRDENYIAQLVDKVGQALTSAVENLKPARLSIGSTIESRISFIRRCIMKDGAVRTHAQPGPNIRCSESVLDPEVGILCVRDDNEKVMGVLVNFACHPTHNGGEPRFSAGWPGVFCNAVKRKLGPEVVPVFLNGALGNAHHANPLNCDPPLTDEQGKQRVGSVLAATVVGALDKLQPIESLSLAASRRSIKIPLRDIDGPFGADMKNRQRFAPDHVYEALIAKLRRKKEKRDHVLAEVQAIRLTPDTALVSLPAEAFTALGLAIKSQSPFPRTYVVAPANGIVGYVPTLEAFDRGGYECTLSMGSKLDPGAAELLIEAALGQLHGIS